MFKEHDGTGCQGICQQASRETEDQQSKGQIARDFAGRFTREKELREEQSQHNG
ncbi:MAG: hypothetical protein QMB40_00520 [Aeromonadaceae bacterium]